MNVKRLFLVYLSALTFLLLSVFTSMVVTELEASDIAEDASQINIAGRQRMLSQRIIYLAQSVIGFNESDSTPTRTDLQTAITELEHAIQLFEGSHKLLSNRDNLSAEEASLYFEERDGQRPLDTQISMYIRHARAILETPDDPHNLILLRDIEQAGLLADLNRIVSIIENSSIHRINLLRSLERGSLILALVIILIELIFVFIPGHRIIQRIIETLQSKNAELEAAYRTSEMLRQEQAEFTYSVSHDLKSPANTIGLVLREFLHDEGGNLNEESREMIDIALATVDRISLQVEDILQYAFATKAEQRLEDLDLSECVHEAVANLAGEIEASNARVEIEADGTVKADRRQLLMLLQNLLENALRYHVKGAHPHVTISAKQATHDFEAEIVVGDDGIGISPENHERIFKLFERLHLREEYPGTGLGLATCKRVVENHKGRIDVASELGAGARFLVWLNRAVDTESPTPKGASA